MQIPTIETDRLILRPHRLDDLAAATAMWADPNVIRHIMPKPSTLQQTWMRMVNYRGQWSWLGFGYWAVEEKATSRFAGEAGFADFKRDLGPSMHGFPEAGWAFATAFHGRGYATEAVLAVNRFGDQRLSLPRTVCLIDAGNAGSIRVAEKTGFVCFDRRPVDGKELSLWARTHSGSASAP